MNFTRRTYHDATHTAVRSVRGHRCKKSRHLGGHRAAGLGTGSTCFDGLVHSANLLATVGTSLADFCTGFAVQRVVVRISRHEIHAGSTGGDAIEHGFDVVLLRVVSSCFQAVLAKRLSTSHLTFVTILDAVIFGSCCLSQHFLLILFRSSEQTVHSALGFSTQTAYRMGVFGVELAGEVGKGHDTDH